MAESTYCTRKSRTGNKILLWFQLKYDVCMIYFSCYFLILDSGGCWERHPASTTLTLCPSWQEEPKSTILIADLLGLHSRMFSGFRSQWMIDSSGVARNNNAVDRKDTILVITTSHSGSFGVYYDSGRKKLL